MANPQAYVYDAAGARTVIQKDAIADVIVRVSIEDTPLLARLPRRKIADVHPQIQEDDIQAIDDTNAHAEFAPAPAAASTARSLNDNVTQDLRKTGAVSDVQLHTAYYGHTNELTYQMGLRMIELKKDMESQIVGDQAQQLPTPANARLGLMKGMSTIIATNVDAVADFNQANFETLVRACVLVSGGNPTEVYLDGTRKNAVASWTEQVTRQTTDKHTIYNEVQTFQSNIGTMFRFHLHKLMPRNIVGTAAVCLALDFRQARWEMLEQIPLSTLELPNTGGGLSRQIRWMFTILCGAEKANFAFLG